jgi:hypothetical protein
MTAARQAPMGMVNVVSTAQLQGKLELFGYGADDRVVNPGDLLIVTTDFVGENMHRQKVEFTLKLRGRDMHLFLEAAKTAEMLWVDNKHWLSAPVNGPRIDTRAMSEIRLGDNQKAIAAFMPPPPNLMGS